MEDLMEDFYNKQPKEKVNIGYAGNGINQKSMFSKKLIVFAVYLLLSALAFNVIAIIKLINYFL